MYRSNTFIINTILRKFKDHELIRRTFTLGLLKVKHALNFKIALLIATLISLPRVLLLFNITEKLVASYTEVSIRDIIVRFLLLFMLSLLSLELNSNLKNIYSKYSIIFRSSITTILNVMLFFGMVQLFVFTYPKIVGETLSKSETGLMYFVYFVILIVTLFIARILKFQIIHQRDLLEQEKLKQQNLQKELTALKNQINPHFLFNSLNSLNSIVRENKEATTFVNKLSFMYRYILQSGDRDMVTLKEELKFLNSYVHMQKTRYRDRFVINIDIETKYLQYELPPLALQLLVENAVKHNEISEDNPLVVSVYTTSEFLIVENEIKPRTSFVDSTGNGLINLDKRYFLLKKQHINISNTDNIFRVKLPLN
ncbi:sensor histidine kinase [Aquimarina sp. AU474]|uniref:sensor histidine kinase n=1 Tax=Aquimarina sp. AU474 TaxID=2108529 RepID=UPI000D68F3A4|nr:histidine kinase [Aquimarina sp. AU474]